MTDIVSTMEQIIIHRLESLLSRDAAMTMKGFSLKSVIAFSAFFICLGLGFILYGIHVWLVDNYTPSIAAILMGVVCIVVAILSSVGVGLSIKYHHQKINMIVPEIIALTHETIELLNIEFGEPIRANPKSAILIATCVGFVMRERLYK